MGAGTTSGYEGQRWQLCAAGQHVREWTRTQTASGGCATCLAWPSCQCCTAATDIYHDQYIIPCCELAPFNHRSWHRPLLQQAPARERRTGGAARVGKAARQPGALHGSGAFWLHSCPAAHTDVQAALGTSPHLAATLQRPPGAPVGLPGREATRPQQSGDGPPTLARHSLELGSCLLEAWPICRIVRPAAAHQFDVAVQLGKAGRI